MVLPFCFLTKFSQIEFKKQNDFINYHLFFYHKNDLRKVKIFQFSNEVR